MTEHLGLVLGYVGVGWGTALLVGVSVLALYAAIWRRAPDAETPWHNILLYWLGVGMIGFSGVLIVGLGLAFGLLVARRVLAL